MKITMENFNMAHHAMDVAVFTVLRFNGKMRSIASAGMTAL